MGVFSGTTAWYIEGVKLKRVQIITSDYTISPTDGTILANGTLTLTLPTSSGIVGTKYFVKNIGDGDITIIGTSNQLIDGETSLILTEKNSSLSLVSDGTGWLIF